MDLNVWKQNKRYPDGEWRTSHLEPKKQKQNVPEERLNDKPAIWSQKKAKRFGGKAEWHRVSRVGAAKLVPRTVETASWAHGYRPAYVSGMHSSALHVSVHKTPDI